MIHSLMFPYILEASFLIPTWRPADLIKIFCGLLQYLHANGVKKSSTLFTISSYSPFRDIVLSNDTYAMLLRKSN